MKNDPPIVIQLKEEEKHIISQIKKPFEEAKDKYETIFRVSPEAIVIIDTHGILVNVNDRLYDWLGYKPEEIIGKNIQELPFLTPDGKSKIIKRALRQ